MKQLDEIVKSSEFKGTKIGDIQRIMHTLQNQVSSTKPTLKPDHKMISKSVTPRQLLSMKAIPALKLAHHIFTWFFRPQKLHILPGAILDLLFEKPSLPPALFHPASIIFPLLISGLRDSFPDASTASSSGH
jgi:hypothetical protein